MAQIFTISFCVISFAGAVAPGNFSQNVRACFSQIVSQMKLLEVSTTNTRFLALEIAALFVHVKVNINVVDLCLLF